ncbi:hypothetical protein C2S51_021865 [Perilla frutescens var. frutescens]|nr:hypothetical protein C2S51_021865 [Perilla frutescens var. frutescens]
MAAYAALTSLLQILDQLEHHPFPPISLDRQQVESLTEIATFLQEFLEGYDSPFVDSDEADPLEMRIADAAYAAEDVIESYIVDNIHFAAAATHDDELINSCRDELNGEQEIGSNEETASFDDEVNSSSGEETNNQKKKICRFFNCFRGSKKPKTDGKKTKSEMVNNLSISTSDYNKEISSVYQDMWKVIEEMDLVKKGVMEMKREKTNVQAHHQLQRNILRSSSFSGKNSSVMVGFDDVLLQLLHKLTGGPSSLQVIPITGMGGIGKTTLARNIFQHGYVKEYFDICVWVTISQRYNTKEILSQILYQASGKSSGNELGVELHKYLYGRRYLLIMDDMWSIDVWEKMKNFFADCNKGSRIVVTTRQSFLTPQLTDPNDVFVLKFLDGDNSWNLFSKTVFGEEGFPPQLEEIGKKIVEKCRGLPLSIVVIGGLLAKSQHTHEHWEHIAHKLNSIVNSENNEYYLKILKLSYHHLPVYLKPSFLYMGIFEEDTRIRVSMLIKLWVSEGFLKPENGKSLETIGEGFLKDLIDRNLILVDQLGSTGNIQFCKMHDLLRDLCLKEAENERFYHVIGQHSRRGIKTHKRLRMVYPGWTFTYRGRVLDTFKSTRSHIRSFICEFNHDSIGLLPNFRLLRILKADEGPDYKLEDVIYKLVNSRYVAIGNSNPLESINLPSSMNFLWNLHTLRIIGGGLIVAPVEIWKMSQLRHVEFTSPGNMYLPDPPSGSSIVILENLQTLKGIRNFKCGEEMVKRIPNIKKLQIVYKETRRHDGDDYCLSNLHSLHQLESLTIMLVDEKDDDLLHNYITFPQSLRKLSLESPRLGKSVGWEEMLKKMRGSLSLLQKLKLNEGVFKTGKWETVEGQFPRLKFLELSWCSGLEQWMIEESSHFPCLEHLDLSGLKELEEIPSEIGEIPTLQSIRVAYCSESVVKSAKKIVDEKEELQGDNTFCVQVQEDKKKQEALQSLATAQIDLHLSSQLEQILQLRKVMMMVEKKSDIRTTSVKIYRKYCMVLEAQEMALGADFAEIYKNSELYREHRCGGDGTIGRTLSRSMQRSYVFDRKKVVEMMRKKIVEKWRGLLPLSMVVIGRLEATINT